MGTVTITAELKKAFEEANIELLSIKSASAEAFYEAIGKAKENNPYGPFVTQHSIEEYKGMRLFLTADETAGIAITDDNNIVSVFNGGSKKGVLKTLLPIAIEKGGRKLDNYNSRGLSDMYAAYGFVPISNVEFDKNFAPHDWNFDRDGEPDVVFWIHNGDSAPDVVLNLGRYLVDWDDIQTFDTYEKAKQFRDQLIAIIDEMERENDCVSLP